MTRGRGSLFSFHSLPASFISKLHNSSEEGGSDSCKGGLGDSEDETSMGKEDKGLRKEAITGTSLVSQWLRNCNASTAGDKGFTNDTRGNTKQKHRYILEGGF